MRRVACACLLTVIFTAVADAQTVPDPKQTQPPTAEHVEAQRERWNKIFASAPPNIRTDANGFLVRVASELKPGEALDIGLGFGRNALYLARQGWRVTGVDISDVGIEQARKIAAAEKLPLTAVREDMFKFDYGTNRYDLIAFLYMGGERQGMAEKITDALKPGGLLVIEHFLRVKDVTLGYPPETLPKLYPNLEVLRYAEEDGVPDYAATQKAGRVVRFLARKPPVK
jgi:SAM-dependent methyltransferase